MPTKTTDIAIVGGGIIGASIAYHLAMLGAKQVTVFEREEALGTGSTAKCAGGVRLQFSSLPNISLSRYSIAALKRFEDEIGVPVDFHQNGYLFLLTDDGHMKTFSANADRQREMGVPVQILTPEEARQIVAGLRIEDLVGATFCSEDGIANPHAIVQGYGKRALELGVRIERESEIDGIDVAGGRVRGVSVNAERWECDLLINAAGPWAAQVGRLADLTVPVEPVRRQFFVTAPLDWVPDGFPLLIDWGTGVYMHKESGGMLVGESDPDEPPGFSQTADWDFLSKVAEHGVARLPRLEDAQILSGWAGLYEVSPDHNAILGKVPDLEGFVCANGFSGHGMQHAPAVGTAIAELIVAGESTTLDISSYSIERFKDGGAKAEHNVI